MLSIRTFEGEISTRINYAHPALIMCILKYRLPIQNFKLKQVMCFREYTRVEKRAEADSKSESVGLL